eukprot:351491-Chlamydomonas_euryale.AAC.26
MTHVARSASWVACSLECHTASNIKPAMHQALTRRNAARQQAHDQNQRSIQKVVFKCTQRNNAMPTALPA